MVINVSILFCFENRCRCFIVFHFFDVFRCFEFDPIPLFRDQAYAKWMRFPCRERSGRSPPRLARTRAASPRVIPKRTRALTWLITISKVKLCRFLVKFFADICGDIPRIFYIFIWLIFEIAFVISVVRKSQNLECCTQCLFVELEQ